MPDIRIYGAGDRHSVELRGLLARAGYRVEFRDIRGWEGRGAEHRGFLLSRGLQCIPQVFDARDRHLGDYDRALTALEQAGPAFGRDQQGVQAP